MVSARYGATFLAAMTMLTSGGCGDVPDMGAGLLRGGFARPAMAEPASGVKTGTEPERPAGVEVYFASARIVGLRLETGRVVERGRQQPYRAEPGDRVGRDGTLVRDGRRLGLLVGRARDVLFTFDRFAADPPDRLLAFDAAGASDGVAAVDRRAGYAIASPDDPAYARPQGPSGVWRKSKVVESARTGRSAFEFVRQHDVFLELPTPMRPGSRYRITLPQGLPAVEAVYRPGATRSEAVHVAQTGFDPDDPYKAAYLSLWLGENVEEPARADHVAYEPPPTFRLIDAATGGAVFEGTARFDAPAAEVTGGKRNYNLADVYELDFSDFRKPGRYRVEVEGVGTSFPFELGEGVWREAYVTSVRGLYHQRSGIALEEPFTGWTRPRSLHPDDGFRPVQSTATLLNTSMGLDLAAASSFEALVAGRSAEPVEGAWGGWHDAGDFDRRIQHLWTSLRLLNLAELRPRFVEGLELNIPESGDGVPDTVDEALWALDLFQRLQKPDGGVPGGIEASGHPRPGEGSWLESQDLFVYAPDPWSSYIYAAAAARAAYVMASYDQRRADAYRAGALAAMAWAEAHGSARIAAVPAVRNARNQAAVELYRLTGEDRWHDLYRATTRYGSEDRWPVPYAEQQHEAAFLYARMKRPTDAALRANGEADILASAERLLKVGHRGGFGQTINPATPYGYGYTSVVPADADLVLIKAYELTGDGTYLARSIGDALFGLGANPDNLVYTTGLGARGPREVLHVDAEALGRAAPPGITIFGQYDALRRGRHFSFNQLAAASHPNYPWRWPLHEMVNGYRLSVPVTEFSIQGTLGQTAFVRGYLAATGPKGPRGAGRR